MNRKKLVLAINIHLKGAARRTRARAGGIAHYFLFYLRQVVRHRYPWLPPLTAESLKQELVNEAHNHGNSILKLMDKDRHFGGEQLKASVADCIMYGMIIEKPLFKAYKLHFRGSRFRKNDWERYNTDIVAGAVLSGFLNSFTPDAGSELKSYSFDLNSGEMKPMTVQDAGHYFVTSHYMDAAMAAVGLHETMWSRNTTDIVSFDYHLVNMGKMISSASYSDRFHLPQWLYESEEQWNYRPKKVKH